METDSSSEEIDSDTPISILPEECTICERGAFDHKNLIRHMKHFHCVEPSMKKANLKCTFSEDCTFLSASNELLRNHLKLAHNFKTEKRVLTFPTKAEFDKWRMEEEVLTNARYVAYTGTKSKTCGKVFYLRCHRNEFVQSESIERKRAKSDKKYTKCEAICPSTIRVSELANGSIQAIYYPDHLGHSLDDESVRYMKLSAIERQEILEKLAKGEPVGKIVSDARKRKGNRLSRLNFLQRRDVYNLKKKVIYLEKDDEHDAKMVHAWIKGLNVGSDENSPIAYYSPLNKYKDYTLILIHDSQKEIFKLLFDGGIVYVKTKKGKPNLDFNLTAVSIVSANGEGLPIAFCISQKAEYITLYTLYYTVFRNYGKITPKFFVSDNLCQSYLAWKNVMGECENQVVCIFDLESYWGQKLTQHRVPVFKQKNATAKLKYLLYELNKDKFEKELDKTLKAWCEDRAMKSFLCFFQKQYAKKFKEWAGCYRTYLHPYQTIDSNLETINGVLDAIYVESYTGLSNALNFIMSYVRDSCMLKLIERDGSVRLGKIQATERNHIEGAEIKSIRTNGSEWVYSQDDYDYIVKKVINDCNKECGMFCSVCDVCVHQYSCLCKDYVFDFNLCKHIHAARMAMARADEEKEKKEKMEMEMEAAEQMEEMAAKKKERRCNKKEKKEKKQKRKKRKKIGMRKKITKEDGVRKTIASKLNAVSTAKSLVDNLEQSELTEAEYKNIADLLSSVQENLQCGPIKVSADVHV